MITVAIADDDHLMRAGLSELLTADPTIAVVGLAADGHEAIDIATRHRPDIMLMDVRMPGLDGIEATRRLTTQVAATKILILTTFEQDDYIFDALRAGASGFLLKRTRPEQLIAAVHTVAAGDALLSPSITRTVIDRIAREPAASVTGTAEVDALTTREREVLDLLARGFSNREIAAELIVEVSTVRTHVKRVLMKLGLRDRIQAVIFAYENGLSGPRPARTKPSTEACPRVTDDLRSMDH